MPRENLIFLGIRIGLGIFACLIIYSLWNYIVTSLAVVGAFTVYEQYQRLKSDTHR